VWVQRAITNPFAPTPMQLRQHWMVINRGHYGSTSDDWLPDATHKALLPPRLSFRCLGSCEHCLTRTLCFSHSWEGGGSSVRCGVM
jgi:hypothetical protein